MALVVPPEFVFQVTTPFLCAIVINGNFERRRTDISCFPGRSGFCSSSITSMMNQVVRNCDRFENIGVKLTLYKV